MLGLCSSVNDIELSDFVICYTKDGAVCMADYELGVTGGTGIAINIADLFNVPVYNLRRNDHRERILNWCQKVERKRGLEFDPVSKHHFHKVSGEILDVGQYGEVG
ncbi:hypothetical protein D3C71_1827720 [compost metagenome]